MPCIYTTELNYDFSYTCAQSTNKSFHVRTITINYTCKMEVQYSSLLIPPTSTNLFFVCTIRTRSTILQSRTKTEWQHFLSTTIFSLKYQTAKKTSSKWECLENFRDSLIIEPKCLVWSRESYSTGFHWGFQVQLLLRSVCVGRDPRRHILSITFWGGEV